MSQKTSIALLLSTYNNPQALKVVLDSILAQTQFPQEMLIADDGSDFVTRRLIDSYRDKVNFTIKHLWQPHEDFQKAIILNKSVAETKCDYIIQIDGDIVLNRHFIRDHIEAAQQGHFIRGSRVILSELKTQKIFDDNIALRFSPFESGVSNRINAMRLPLLRKFFTKYSNRSDNMHGCNCSFWRKDFVKVNGYNNLFTGWGHEDIELAARFVNAGLKQKKIKMSAVCYHLHHPVAERHRVEKNYKIYQDVVRSGVKHCLNGYKQQYTYQD